MSGFEEFDFDPVLDNEKDGFSLFEDSDSEKDTGDTVCNKRTSADFQPDMDALLITAQSSMIVEAINLYLNCNFKHSNVKTYSEAVNGINLFIKLIERNPGHFQQLTSTLSSDYDLMEVLKISYNTFSKIHGETPDSDSKKLKAFEIIRGMLNKGYLKSIISQSILNIKDFFLLSGGLDYSKFEMFFKQNPAELKKNILLLMKHVKLSSQMVKDGDIIINPTLKGRDLNNYLINATELLSYYFQKTGNEQYQLYYERLNENYKKYFIVR